MAQTITPLADKQSFGPWIFQDLPHASIVIRLRMLLTPQLPESLLASENLGVLKQDGRSYFIPDLLIFDADLLGAPLDAMPPSTVSLVVEVVAASNPGNDHVIKRNGYAITGVREYWIVDPRTETVHVLTQPTPTGYVSEHKYVKGDVLTLKEPFPLEIPVSSLFS